MAGDHVTLDRGLPQLPLIIESDAKLKLPIIDNLCECQCLTALWKGKRKIEDTRLTQIIAVLVHAPEHIAVFVVWKFNMFRHQLYYGWIAGCWKDFAWQTGRPDIKPAEPWF